MCAFVFREVSILFAMIRIGMALSVSVFLCCSCFAIWKLTSES